MFSGTSNHSGPKQKPLVHQHIPNAMIDDELDDPSGIPRPRSNPAFGNPQRIPNETQDDTLAPNYLQVPSSMFQRAREVDIGGNPSFVNGNVYHYNHYNHVTKNLAQISTVDSAARRNERRAGIIKELGEEVKELNQLLQEKIDELAQVEDTANRQNEKQTEDIKQLEAEVGTLHQLLQQKTTELASLEDAANREKERHEKMIRVLEERVSGMITEMSRVEDTANRQNTKQAEDIKRLEVELGKLNQLLQEKMVELASLQEAANRGRREYEKIGKLEGKVSGVLTSISRVEDTANRQNAKQAEDVKRLEKEVKKVNQLLQEKRAELASLEEAANREKGRYKKLIRILEEKVSGAIADMNQQKEMHEEKMQALQVKVWNLVEDMNQRKAKYEEEIRGLKAKVLSVETFGCQREREHTEKIERLEANVSNMKEIVILQKQKHEEEIECFKTMFSTMAAQLFGLENVVNKASLPHTSIYGEQTNNRPRAVVHKADSMSVMDVADLVKTLNAQIEQTVHYFARSLSNLERPVSDNGLETAFDELRNYLGPWLCSKLRENSELDPLIIQITLQTGLVNICSCIANDPLFWFNGSIYCQIYRNMAKTDQAVADEWRAQALHYITLAQCEDANKKSLTETVPKLIAVAVRGTLTPEYSESLLSRYYYHQVEEIARIAAKLHKTITEDVTSVELITYTVPCDTEFDASQMEDTEYESGSTRPHGKVICTQDMGLLCGKRGKLRKPCGPLKDWAVTMKAKVVLAATLGA